MEAFQARHQALLDQGREEEIDVRGESKEKRTWLLFQLTDQAMFTHKTYQALQKNFGPLTPRGYYELLTIYNQLPLSAYGCVGLSFNEYLLDRMEISLEDARAELFFTFIPASYGFWHGYAKIQKRLIIRLLASGADLNEQYPKSYPYLPEDGGSSQMMPLLQHILYHRLKIYSGINRIEPSERKDPPNTPGYYHIHQRDPVLCLNGEDRQLIRYLLEKGADPLLQGWNGENAMEMVETIDRQWGQDREGGRLLPEEEKAWLLVELRKWA